MKELFAKNRPLLLTVGVIAIVVSIAATLGSLYFLSDTNSGRIVREKLGLNGTNGLNIETTRVDKIVVEESSAVIDASKKVGSAVVSITSTGKAIRDVFGLGVIEAPKTSGTGFIVTSDGLVATNKHVISGGESYSITTAEGKVYDGKVVATDPVNDIAFVKVEARGLPVADLGDSDKVQVAQWVIAIGNALGELQNSVTVGVISARERSTSASNGSSGTTESLDGLFQTDAAINPGNSGGPLVNLAGQVIGVNTAMAQGAQSIGFAIPINDLKKDLESYNKNGKVVQPYIGVRYQTITKAIAKSSNLAVDQGALLISTNGSPAVAPSSPAERAGLKDGDIITKVDSDKVTETTTLSRLIRRHNPGDKITLTILRAGKEITADLTLSSLGQ